MGNRFKRQAKRKERARQKKQSLLQVKASSKDSIPPLEVKKDDTDQRTEVSLSELEAM